MSYNRHILFNTIFQFMYFDREGFNLSEVNFHPISYHGITIRTCTVVEYSVLAALTRKTSIVSPLYVCMLYVQWQSKSLTAIKVIQVILSYTHATTSLSVLHACKIWAGGQHIISL